MKRLRELRKERGLKQSEVAAILGTTPQAIANYELDKREPGIDELIVLASFFNVSIDYLVGRDKKGDENINMNKVNNLLKNRLDYKKKELEQNQKSFMVLCSDINTSAFERNAINSLIIMQELKAEIEELEFLSKVFR